MFLQEISIENLNSKLLDQLKLTKTDEGEAIQTPKMDLNCRQLDFYMVENQVFNRPHLLSRLKKTIRLSRKLRPG